MEILYHKNFLKNFRKRILPKKSLVARFEERLNLFVKDPSSPLLRNHRLVGRKGVYHSFSITGDYRVIYQKTGQVIILYDIGTHNQVY